MVDSKLINVRLKGEELEEFIKIYQLFKENNHIAGSSFTKCAAFLIKAGIQPAKVELVKMKRIREEK